MLSPFLKESLEEATAEYHAQVEQVAPYLVSRGLDQRAAAEFRLGYVGTPRIGDDQYAGRLVIPYLTPTGVIDIRYRSVGHDDGPKYLSRAGADIQMFNVLAFGVDSDVIAVCEGEIDTMITHAMCGIPAVGLPGVNAWKSFYHRAFADYSRVFVLCDGDQPGRDLGKRISQSLDVATVIHMPDGMDCNDVYLQEGPDGIRRRVGM